jgi:hypothetical protein
MQTILQSLPRGQIWTNKCAYRANGRRTLSRNHTALGRIGNLSRQIVALAIEDRRNLHLYIVYRKPTSFTKKCLFKKKTIQWPLFLQNKGTIDQWRLSTLSTYLGRQCPWKGPALTCGATPSTTQWCRLSFRETSLLLSENIDTLWL